MLRHERRGARHVVGGIVLVGTLAAATVTGSACGSGGSDDGDDEPAAAPSAPTSTTSTTRGTRPTTGPPATQAPTTAEPPTTLPERPRLVVLDPGHNGANGAHPEVINRQVDAGGFEKACNTVGSTTDSGIGESQVNWELAQALRDRLEEAGVEVVLTRDSDDGVGPCVDERGRVAVEAQADLLVSLHADGASPELGGFHVIHPGLRPTYTDRIVEPSAELAGQVRDALVDAGFTPASYVGAGGLHQRDDLGTLNLAGVPAVMVEAGNLRHAGDAVVLTSPAGRDRLADALATAILTNLA